MSAHISDLTVSMPFWRSAETLRRAVDSVLGQTFQDLTLVVVNDGGGPEAWEPLADLTDSRLVRFDLVTNRGRYVADALVAQACKTPWFTVHDADDWSDPRRLERMMAIAQKTHADVVPGAETIHGPNRRNRIRAPQLRASHALMHHWHMSALYRTEVFRQVSCPSFRVGYDTLMSSLLARNRELKIVPSRTPDYHRVARNGSLTKDPLTGIGSVARQREVARLLEILRSLPVGRIGWAEIDRALSDAASPVYWNEVHRQAAHLQQRMLDAPLTSLAGRYVAQNDGRILFDAPTPEEVMAELTRTGQKATVWRVPATPEEAGGTVLA